jgi:hypothetical protein
MKILAFIASALLAVTLPAIAAEYQGKTIDGERLPAKAYSYATGGVFEAEVEFRGNLAILYFVNGSQLAIRLSQPMIRDPKNIVGFGHVGQFPLGRALSIGIGTDPALTGSLTFEGGSFSDTWIIHLWPDSPV